MKCLTREFGCKDIATTFVLHFNKYINKEALKFYCYNCVLKDYSTVGLSAPKIISETEMKMYLIKGIYTYGNPLTGELK